VATLLRNVSFLIVEACAGKKQTTIYTRKALESLATLGLTLLGAAGARARAPVVATSAATGATGAMALALATGAATAMAAATMMLRVDEYAIIVVVRQTARVDTIADHVNVCMSCLAARMDATSYAGARQRAMTSVGKTRGSPQKKRVCF